MGKLDNRIALVTGASRGIGYHAALAYAKEGAHVVAVAKTVGGLEELDDEIRTAGGSATLVPMDITDYEAIDRLGQSIDQRWGRLDMFLANAGILGGLSPLGHFDPKEFEKVMAVNLTANWRFVRSLDPLLKASDAGRAIFMSSGAVEKCAPFWGAYSISKAALEALAKTWAAECTSTNVKVNMVNPGAMRTAMRAQAMPGEEPETLPHPAEIADDLVMLGSADCEKTGGLWVYGSGWK